MANILVADDDFFNVQVLQAILKNANHIVYPVYGGKEAINTLESENIDILLLDLLMPGIGGHDVLKYISEKNIKVPVIVVSALTDEKNKNDSLNEGAVDFITKPFINSDVLEKVESFLK